MSILGRIERPKLLSSVQFEPLDDFWFNPTASPTMAGFPMSPDMAMRCSTVFACNSLILETVASLPCILYRRLDDGGKQRAKEHRWYRPIRYQPNLNMSAMDFFGFGQCHLGLRGTFAAEINETDPTAPALLPIHPDRITVEELANGRLRGRVRDRLTGTERILSQDQMLLVRDTSMDGVVGVARSFLAREAIALASAAEAMSAGYFKNDATGRLLFSFPNPLSDKSKQEMTERLEKTVIGWQHSRRPMFVDQGGKVEPLGGPDEAAFLIDPRRFQVADIARFWRVPLFMIGLEEKSTTWGTGIEQQKQGFVDFTIRPWLTRWQQALARDLLTEDEQEEFFFEFLLDDLLRGDILATVQSLNIEKSAGALSRNEWRIIRNRNPVPGGDAFQETPPGTAPNGGAAGMPEAMPGKIPAGMPADDVAGDEQAAAFAPFLADAAGRIAGSELREVEKKAALAAEDPAKWRAWAGKFYGEHRRYAAKVVAPLSVAMGLEAWVADSVGARIEATALEALAAGVPPGWAERRTRDVELLIRESLAAGAAVRRAA